MTVDEKEKYRTKMWYLRQILHERHKQDEKFPDEQNTKERWLTILGEEFGEVARAILIGDQLNYEHELIQLAAVALAALEDFQLSDPE